MKYRTCPHCRARIAFTPQNPTGICPAYGCEENKHFYEFYEANINKQAYNERMNITEKYKGLYFKSNDGTLHFFYGLSNKNMLFIKDIDLALYVYNESELQNLTKYHPDNNLQSHYSS